MIEFFAPGTPRPQGSLRPVVSRTTGRTIVKPSAKMLAWRKVVAAYAKAAYKAKPITGPVRVRFTFCFLRPAKHFGTGRNAKVLKANAPILHLIPPDVDKLTRAVCDALTGTIWADDSQVIEVYAVKRYNNQAGLFAVIEEVLI